MKRNALQPCRGSGYSEAGPAKWIHFFRGQGFTPTLETCYRLKPLNSRQSKPSAPLLASGRTSPTVKYASTYPRLRETTSGALWPVFPRYRFATLGFTLVELIVVMAMVSLIMGAIYSVFVRSNRVYISQEEVVATQQEARSAMEILGREIRMAGFIAANNRPGGLDLITAAAWAAEPESAIEVATVDTPPNTTILVFKSDLDGDGSTDAVRYIYYHTDHAVANRRNTLTRQVLTWSGGAWNDLSGAGEQTFLENIQNLTLTYQMADGTTTATPGDLDDIRGVVISLTAQTSREIEPYEGGKGLRTRQLTSNIRIRNMGLS